MKLKEMKRGTDYCLRVVIPATRRGLTPKMVVYKKVHVVDFGRGGTIAIEDYMQWNTKNLFDQNKVAVKKSRTIRVRAADILATWADWTTKPKEVRKGELRLV